MKLPLLADVPNSGSLASPDLFLLLFLLKNQEKDLLGLCCLCRLVADLDPLNLRNPLFNLSRALPSREEVLLFPSGLLLLGLFLSGLLPSGLFLSGRSSWE